MGKSRTIFFHHEGFVFGRNALLRVHYSVHSTLEILRKSKRARGHAAAVPNHLLIPPNRMVRSSDATVYQLARVAIK